MPDRPLPSDHRFIVERVDEGEIALAAAAHRFVTGFVVIRAHQHDLGAVAARRGHLRDRGRERHADFRGNAALGGMVGDGLRVVSRRRGDHSPLAFLVREQKNLVQRAAFLKRAGHLQMVELEKDGIARELGKCLGAHEGRQIYRISYAFARLADGLNRQQIESPDCFRCGPLYPQLRLREVFSRREIAFGALRPGVIISFPGGL